MQKAEVNIDSKVNEVFATTTVTQRILNNSDKPIELEAYILKNLDNIIFSSFYAQIGNSTKVKSKVIKKEKAEEKYSDAISSGNASIFTAVDPNDKNNIIVHIGNLPPKQELIFTSEFIQFTESSNNSFEYELFGNIPILKGKEGYNLENNIIKGTLEIKMKGKFLKTEKKFSDKLIVKQDKNDIKNNMISLKYEYDKSVNEEKIVYEYEYPSGGGTLAKLFRKKKKKLYSSYNTYIPTSKIYFKLDSNNNLFSQISSKNKNEQSFLLNYKFADIEKSKSKTKKTNKEEIKLSPALFIFLIDQSGSMSGSAIKVASKALLLFLQSLPAGSYYQIIGFGSNYKAYDKTPKEYNQKNIEESIKIVEELKGNMGGTDIYAPLNYIYKSKSNYDNILLPKNIFLLTDGEIENKNQTLNLIEKKSNDFAVHSIGIGSSFDEDLIKNAGIIGKGSFSFCKDISGLNQVIVSTLNTICTPFVTNFEIRSPLDELNLYKINNKNINIKENSIYKFNYIIDKKLEEKKIKFLVKYNKEGEDKTQNYELEPKELPSGDELSKLIINNYILNNSSLSEEEKIKLALKYQLFIEGTSLFAEVELSEKITEQMEHKEIIKEKETSKKLYEDNKENILEQKIKEQEDLIDNLDLRINALSDEIKNKLQQGDEEGAKRNLKEKKLLTQQIMRIEGNLAMMEEQKFMLSNVSSTKDMMQAIQCGNQNIKEASKAMNIEDLEALKDDMEEINPNQEELNDFFKDYQNQEEDINEELDLIKEEMGKQSNEKKNLVNEEKLENNNKEEEDLAYFLDGYDYPKNEIKKEEKKEEKKKEEKEEEKKEKEVKLNLKNKEDVMKIINSQNFVEGYYDINSKTMIIKNKYEKEFNLLKGLKGKKIDDIVAMTIIIIYFINKEKKELLQELVMIMKKAKLYIQDKTGLSYDEIIKQATIN